MNVLPAPLTVALVVVAVSVLFALYQMLVLPLQSLGIFLIALGLGIAVVAKRFGLLLSLRRGHFALRRSPLFVSIVLVAAGAGILAFGVMSLVLLGLLVWWRVRGLEPVRTTSLSRVLRKAPVASRVWREVQVSHKRL